MDSIHIGLTWKIVLSTKKLCTRPRSPAQEPITNKTWFPVVPGWAGEEC